MEYIKNDELEHHGILGMKWGVRRYQNEDGSLKPAGKKRYANRYERAAAALERDKADFEKYKDTGIQNKKGKTLVSREEVASIIDGLQKQIDKNVVKSDNLEAKKLARGKELDDQRVSVKNIKTSTALKDLGVFAVGSTATNILSAMGFALDMPVASALANLGGTATIAGMAYVTAKGVQDVKSLRSYYAKTGKG